MAPISLPSPSTSRSITRLLLGASNRSISRSMSTQSGMSSTTRAWSARSVGVIGNSGRHRVAVSSRHAAFGTSAPRGLKESDRDVPDLAEKNEKHKQDQIQKQKEGKGHWKPELASDSEEAVTADRHEHNDHSQAGMEELQEKTKEFAEKKHKHGTSMEPGM